MNDRPLRLIRLVVTQNDIDEMYERYDSGMADLTTANAVCVALRKKIGDQFHPQIFLPSQRRGCRLKMGSECFPLPEELHDWLEKTNQGRVVCPTTFLIRLPEEIFAEASAPAKHAGETAIAA